MSTDQKIQDLEKALAELRASFIQAQKNQTTSTSRSDIAYSKVEQVDINQMGVFENDRAVCDVADMSDVNSMAIDDIAALVDDLEQRVTALEEK